MATFTASAAQSTVQPKGLRVGLVAVKSVYSFNVSIGAADVIQLVKVPAGATPVFISIGTSSTSGFLMFELGDGIVSGRYRSMASLSAAQGMVLANIPAAQQYTYSQDDTIDAVMSVATAVSLTGALYTNVIFSMDAIS